MKPRLLPPKGSAPLHRHCGPRARDFSLGNRRIRANSLLFFETRWTLVHHCHSQASGNPVKIGGGCATVTGYKLPKPLVPQSGAGKAGVRLQARSQDTGLAVLVVAGKVDRGELRVDSPKTQRCVFHQPSTINYKLSANLANFSVTEKDEASPSREGGMGFAECLHSPMLPGSEGLLFPDPALVSQSLTQP